MSNVKGGRRVGHAHIYIEQVLKVLDDAIYNKFRYLSNLKKLYK